MPSETIPPGLAILDAPDIDSVEEANRTLAAQLLAAADLWLFVTSAARYADQVPWQFLREASERSAAVAIVLDRTPEDAVETVASHLARMLASRGLKDSPLFTVHEGPVDDEGLLPAESVAEIRVLAGLAGRGRRRAGGGGAPDPGRGDPPGRAPYPRGRGRRDRAGRRRDPAARGRRRAPTTTGSPRSHEASADGTLLRGEVLARWQEFVGTGELLRSPGDPGGLAARQAGQRDQGQAPAGRAGHRSRSSRAWRPCSPSTPRRPPSGRRPPGSRSPPGRRCSPSAGEDLGRASRDFRRRAERAVRDWQGDVLAMVRDEGADKRTTARFLAYGVNGLSVALMVVVFAHTGGALVGAEAGIAGGGAVLGQKLLEAVFGDQAVRVAGRAGPQGPGPPGRGAVRRRAPALPGPPGPARE